MKEILYFRLENLGGTQSVSDEELIDLSIKDKTRRVLARGDVKLIEVILIIMKMAMWVMELMMMSNIAMMI